MLVRLILIFYIYILDSFVYFVQICICILETIQVLILGQEKIFSLNEIILNIVRRVTLLLW